MGTKRGRTPGRALEPLELRHLLLIKQLRDLSHETGVQLDEQLENYVLDLRDGGASVRGIAEALNVGSSTVQTWTTNARRRRT